MAEKEEQKRLDKEGQKRAAIYVRVSTAEQKEHGLSVDNQLDALKNYCQERGFSIAGIYNDAGISARKKYKSRPALLQLLEDCKKHKIDIILFTKLDRWFRSVADYYAVQQVLDGAKVPWRAIWEDYETETSAGVFKVNIMLSVAQAESDRTSERIKAVLEYKREHGHIIAGRMPLGYIRTSSSTIDYDPATKDAMQAFFNTYLDTYSPVAAMDAARKLGLRMSRKTAHFILDKEPYYGTYYGVDVPAYITPEQHKIIEQARVHYPRTPKDDRVYIFTGVIFCASCGARMCSKLSKHIRANGETIERGYYQCCTKVRRKDICEKPAFVMEHKLEDYLIEHMSELITDYEASIAQSQEKAKDAEKEISRIKGKLQRLKDVYLDGDMGRAEYVEKTSQLKADMAELESQRVPLSPIKQLPDDWEEMYWQLSKDGKRDFWHRTIRRIEIDGKKVSKVFFI